MDALDNPTTAKGQSIKIVCEDYPNVYKEDYVPTLLKLSPTYTEQGLHKYLDSALNFYKQKPSVEFKV